MKSMRPFFACGLIVTGLTGCIDPQPDQSFIEPTRSILSMHPAGLKQPTPDQPLQIQLNETIQCGNAAETTSAAVSWQVFRPGIAKVEIHIRSASESEGKGKLWVLGPPKGVQKTPEWVQAGMIFELRDAMDGTVYASQSVPCE